MITLTIENALLIETCGKLTDGHITYGYGSKAPSLTSEPSKITKIDCSGFVRYLIYNATKKSIMMPDGSWGQKTWCDQQKFESVDYGTAKEKDSWLRIAFIRATPALPGHVWLILDGLTMESHGLTKGPDRRAWDSKDLKKSVYACYKMAQSSKPAPNRPINFRHLA